MGNIFHTRLSPVNAPHSFFLKLRFNARRSLIRKLERPSALVPIVGGFQYFSSCVIVLDIVAFQKLEISAT